MNMPPSIDLAVAPRERVRGLLPLVASGGPAAEDPRIGREELFNDGSVRFGIWGCGPCRWEVPPRDCAETMVMVSGSLRLTSERDGVVELTAGDAFHMPRGWTGTWEVLTTMRKVYTVIDG